MEENEDLIREIDSLLSNPVTKEEIETKLVNSRSNSVNSHSGSHLSIEQNNGENESFPSFGSMRSGPNESVPSVLRSPPSEIEDSVVHQEYHTPNMEKTEEEIGFARELPQHSDIESTGEPLKEPDPVAQARHAELEQLHKEIEMLTERQSISGARPEGTSPYAPGPAVDLPHELPHHSGPSKDISMRSEQDASFSTQYISELERENARIRRNYILKDIERLKSIAEEELFSKSELEYVIEKTIQQFCRM